MSESDYEELSIWMDVLDDVVNGHDDGLICPFCEKVSVEVDRSGGQIEVRCTTCGKYVKGLNAY